MDFQALKAELATDPLGVGYAGMTDVQAADALNAKTRTQIVEKNVNAKTVLSHLGRVEGPNFLDAIQAAASTDRAVWWMQAYLQTDTGINVGDPETRAALDDMLAAGILTPASVAKIKALAEKPISRAEELGLGHVTEGDVQFARGMV